MEKSGFIQDINGTWIWNPMLAEHESCEWTGPSKNGYASGFGTLVWYWQRKPVSTYVGNMQDGKCHGKGIYHFVNGDKYDGEWYKGVRHGYGVHIAKDGKMYKGNWADDKRSEPGSDIS